MDQLPDDVLRRVPPASVPSSAPSPLPHHLRTSSAATAATPVAASAPFSTPVASYGAGSGAGAGAAPFGAVTGASGGPYFHAAGGVAALAAGSAPGAALRVPVTVEVCLKADSLARPGDVQLRVKSLLEAKMPEYKDGPVEFAEDDFLRGNVLSISVCDVDDSPRSSSPVPFNQAQLQVFVFQLNDDGVSEEHTDGEEEVTACHQWVLPSTEFQGVWENLVYDSGVKSSLLEYASTAMLFSDKSVDSNIISWNRVVLLHGPPGTGKTSLCKALAHKLAIRMSQRYPNGILLEINAHSLFSKWFSESGKLVMRLFQHIRELVEGEDALVCVLIDEVESLTAARKSALSGSEPSDAVRVVNALLTQIDALRSMGNVLVLTTSNITEAIDLAFVDRADIKQFIGLPSHKARYVILRGCMEELMRVGIIQPPQPIAHFDDLARTLTAAAPSAPGSSTAAAPAATAGAGAAASTVANRASLFLYNAASKAEGLSGRALCKLPFQAHAFFIHSPTSTAEAFAAAFDMAVDKEQANRVDLCKEHT